MINHESIMHFIRKTIRIFRTAYLELKAAATGKKFYCVALSGNSTSNISINCDLTVTCNCKDFDGEGQIGDLHDSTFEQIFDSERANSFRKKLAAGKLAIANCSTCRELQTVDKKFAQKYITEWHLPHKGLMVENTISCPYHCLSCNRKLVKKSRNSVSMDISGIKKVASLIRENNIEHIFFLNLGDPFASKDILEQLTIIRKENPHLSIHIATNGLLLNSDKKRQAALLADKLSFSIDGFDNKTLSKYQRGGSFDKVYKNLKELTAYRDLQNGKKPTIEWKYILFNWNDRHDMVHQAIEMARQAGVDSIYFAHTSSPIYGISWRYYLTSTFKNIGEPSGKGRRIFFKKD